jgi:hypothetical protein
VVERLGPVDDTADWWFQLVACSLCEELLTLTRLLLVQRSLQRSAKYSLGKRGHSISVDLPRPSMSLPNRPGMALYIPSPGMPGITPGFMPIIGIPIPIILIPIPIIGFIIIIGFMSARIQPEGRERGAGASKWRAVFEPCLVMIRVGIPSEQFRHLYRWSGRGGSRHSRQRSRERMVHLVRFAEFGQFSRHMKGVSYRQCPPFDPVTEG